MKSRQERRHFHPLNLPRILAFPGFSHPGFGQEGASLLGYIRLLCINQRQDETTLLTRFAELLTRPWLRSSHAGDTYCTVHSS